MDHERLFLETVLKYEDDRVWGTTWKRVYGGYLYVTTWWTEEVLSHVLVVDRLATATDLDMLHFVLDGVVKHAHLEEWLHSGHGTLEEISSVARGYDNYGLVVPHDRVTAEVESLYRTDDRWGMPLCVLPETGQESVQMPETDAWGMAVTIEKLF